MSDDIDTEAARWHGLQDSDAMDWDLFTRWLEADPLHRRAFDAMALLDDDVTAQRVAIVARLDHVAAPYPSPRPRRVGWLTAGSAAAAAAAAAVAVVFGVHGTGGSPATTTYRTAAGQTRALSLQDGSRIDLASLSSLSVAGPHQDQLTLTGSAYFDIPHRPGRDLAISANDVTVHDIGTRFAIDAGRSGTRVAVAVGTVAVTSSGASGTVTVDGGRSLALLRSGIRAQLATVRPADVASWRRGALVYQAAPLALVADDISRYAGGSVTVDPAIAGRRFSGVLSIGDGSALATDVAAIMALRARTVDGGVRLEPAHHP